MASFTIEFRLLCTSKQSGRCVCVCVVRGGAVSLPLCVFFRAAFTTNSPSSSAARPRTHTAIYTHTAFVYTYTGSRAQHAAAPIREGNAPRTCPPCTGLLRAGSFLALLFHFFEGGWSHSSTSPVLYNEEVQFNTLHPCNSPVTIASKVLMSADWSEVWRPMQAVHHCLASPCFSSSLYFLFDISPLRKYRKTHVSVSLQRSCIASVC